MQKQMSHALAAGTADVHGEPTGDGPVSKDPSRSAADRPENLFRTEGPWWIRPRWRPRLHGALRGSGQDRFR